MFHVQNVTLLQPEDVMQPRLPGGANALAAYFKAIELALNEHYSAGSVSGPRTLVLAVGPGGRAQFWLASPDALSADERDAVEGISARLTPPVVVDGPVILAVTYSVGVNRIAQQGLTMPSEWQAVVARTGGPLSVDEVVAQLWTTAQT